MPAPNVTDLVSAVEVSWEIPARLASPILQFQVVFLTAEDVTSGTVLTTVGANVTSVIIPYDELPSQSPRAHVAVVIESPGNGTGPITRSTALFEASTATSGSSDKKVALAAGITAALVVLALFLLFLYLRRRQSRLIYKVVGVFYIDRGEKGEQIKTRKK